MSAAFPATHAGRPVDAGLWLVATFCLIPAGSLLEGEPGDRPARPGAGPREGCEHGARDHLAAREATSGDPAVGPGDIPDRGLVHGHAERGEALARGGVELHTCGEDLDVLAQRGTS